MKGALVFLIVFAILVIATLGNTDIPPGKAIYSAVLPGTEAAAGYIINGVDAITVIIAVFNGVIYGFVAWLIFSLVMLAFKKDKKQQTVNVYYNNEGNYPPPPP